MKSLSVVKIFTILLGLCVFGGASAYAQMEVDPDHYDSPSTEAFKKAETHAYFAAAPIQYKGTFRLPYSVQCNGQSLAPGKYSILLRSNGKQGHATLKQNGQAIALAGVVHEQGHFQRSDALIVEIRGKTRRISSIELATLDLVLGPTSQTKGATDRKPSRVDRLPLRATLQRNDASRMTPQASSQQY
jgi:hypothetical protein